ISFGALIAAQVSFMRMFGLGLMLAVLIDATLVRMVLLPAFMHLMGRWNWWAPAPLARWHARRTGTAEQNANPAHPGPPWVRMEDDAQGTGGSNEEGVRS